MQRTALNYFHCRSFANIIIITIINKCWYLFYRSCDKIGPLWRLVRLVQKPSIFSNNAYYQLFFIYKGQYKKNTRFFFPSVWMRTFFSGWNNAFDSPWGRGYPPFTPGRKSHAPGFNSLGQIRRFQVFRNGGRIRGLWASVAKSVIKFFSKFSYDYQPQYVDLFRELD